jgi:hypothetical protein
VVSNRKIAKALGVSHETVRHDRGGRKFLGAHVLQSVQMIEIARPLGWMREIEKELTHGGGA